MQARERRDGGAWVDTTQRELDWHKKTIGMYEGLVRKLRAEHGGGRLIEIKPLPFDYGVPAELFMAKRKGGPRQRLRYRRFATAAEAIRFAVEELPAVALGAWMQVGDQRFDGDDIQRLYESDDFPLQRRLSE